MPVRLFFSLVFPLLLILAVLGALYSRAERVSPERHLLYTAQLRSLRETNARIDAELLANRLALSRNYDTLSAQVARAEHLATQAQQLPDYLSADDAASVAHRVSAVQLAMTQKSEKIDLFKRQDAVVSNSLAYFPVIAAELIDSPLATLDPVSYRRISDYVRQVQTLASGFDARHLGKLKQRRGEMGQLQLSPDYQAKLDNLLRHGDKIVSQLPQLDALTRDILSQPMSTRLAQLYQGYGHAYQNAQAQAVNYRNLLYALAIVLALFLCWTFWHLSRAQRSLARAHTELSKRFAAQLEVEKRLKLHATAFHNAHDGISLTDAKGNILEVNPAFSRITGWAHSEVIGRNPRVLKSGRHDEAFYRAMWKSIAETGNWSGEIWNRNKYGEIYPELLSISAVRDSETQALTNYVAVFSDIRRLKLQEHQLTQMAYYDTLTELPNRTLLADRFAQAIAMTRRNNTLMAICYLDLDGFKPINDRWGHEAGDRVLLEVSQRLAQTVRGSDTIARIGGDEFALLLVGLASQQACADLLQRILTQIEQPLSCLPQPESVSASIGVTFYPLDDEEPDTLLRHADLAMYQAKQAGKRTFHVFDTAKDRSQRTRLDHIARLRQALDNGEFVLFYQPKVDMRAGVVIGAEALIRWQHPTRGLLGPADFLPFIEGEDLVRRVGNWVIEEALSQLEAWRAEYIDLLLSVNIAGAHLQSPNFVQELRLALQRHPLVASQLELEVLETVALEDVVKTSRVIDECKALGVRFSLDDFGTGYSSLTYLKRLPAETIKIDQSFVRELLSDSNNLAIVQGVIGLANAFQRTVIAEGVESVEHGRLLMQLNCNLAQGYGIARPMPASAFSGWVRSWQVPDAWVALKDLYWSESDYPVFAAEVQHRNWVAQLIGACRDGVAPSPSLLSGDYQCLFGRWYHHQGSARYGELPAFAAIQGPHHRLHAIAARVDALWRSGTPQQAKALVPEIEAQQAQMLDALHALQMALAVPKHQA